MISKTQQRGGLGPTELCSHEKKMLQYFIIIMKQKAKQTFPAVSTLSTLIQKNCKKKILVFFPNVL
jgi:hypothetical protein